jgi:hypothetical protein
MKLNKDQKQKIILGSMLMVGVVYATNDFLLSPLAAERATMAQTMTDAQPKVREMRGQLARTRDLATKGPLAEKTVKQVNMMIPDGAPIAWFPPKVADFFKSRGIDKAAAKMNNESVDKDLAGYRRLVWAVEIPRVDYVPFGNAIAELENSQPLFEITGFELIATRESPDALRASLTVQNIVKL